MGSIIKRGTNTWLLKYDEPRESADGPRKQSYKTIRGTKEDAKRELAKIVTQLHQGTYIKPVTTTVGEWIEFWLKTHAEPYVTPKTFERYSQLARVHIIPALGRVQLQRLSIQQIQNFYGILNSEGLTNSRRSRETLKVLDDITEVKLGLAPRTIRHVHRILSMVLAEAVRSNEIFRNPAREMKAPRFASKEIGEGGSEQIKALNRDQLNLLLNSFSGKPLFAILFFAAGTGARQGEILALRWSDINLNEGSVWVKRSVEDSKVGQRFKTPKGRVSREIKIDKRLADILRNQWREQAEMNLKIGIRFTAEALVFPRSPITPTVPMLRHGLSRAVSKSAAGLGYTGFSFHGLRHTHASLLLTANPPVPLTIVSRRLGHKNPGITASIYSHFISDGQDRAATEAGKILEDVLGG
jgi:integrase